MMGLGICFWFDFSESFSTGVEPINIQHRGSFTSSHYWQENKHENQDFFMFVQVRALEEPKLATTGFVVMSNKPRPLDRLCVYRGKERMKKEHFRACSHSTQTIHHHTQMFGLIIQALSKPCL